MKHLIKLLLISILSIIFVINLSAQTEMTNWKYQLDLEPANRSQIYVPRQRHSTYLKLMNPHRLEQYDYILGLTIKKAIEEGTLNIYKTEKVNNPYPRNEVSKQLDMISLDTFITYHEETYEEILQVIESKESRFPTENTVYQLQQNWTFDKSKQKLNNSIHVIRILNGFEKEGNEETVFYIKNKSNKKRINPRKLLNKKKINWAKSIYFYGEFKDKELRSAILSQSHLRKHKVINMVDFKEMNQAEVNGILAGSVDTLLDYKVDDIEPQISIVREEALTAENVFEFKILQDFYYDTKTNSILTKIVAIAPAIKKYDDGGNYLYTIPLFWIVYDDNFMKNKT